jgi:hypothetical protein
MASLDSLRQRFKGLQGKEINLAALAIDSIKEEIADLNREQLMEGKKADGTEITPSYYDDPYFKSRESAQRYSDWKDIITPNDLRKSGTPNLFINGRFHDSIAVKVSSKSVIFSSPDLNAFKIEAKFGNGIYGSTNESKKQIKEKAQPAFIKSVREFVKL